MAYTFLERFRWTTQNPAIYINVYYDLQRVGSAMQYKIKWVIEPVSGASYYGYAIYQSTYLDGALVTSTLLKQASDNQWTSSIERETGWFNVANKTTGTTALATNIYAGTGSSRNETHYYTLPIIPAASALGAISNFNVEATLTLSITKYNSGYVDNLAIKYGETTIRSAVGVSNGYSVTFTSEELATIFSLMTAVNSGAFTFELSTYDGETLLGTSTQTPTGTITNASPALSASVVDTNSATVALTGNSATLVKYRSTAQISIAATGNKGATIVSKIVNGTAVTGDTLTLANVSTSPFVVTVTDSRGNSATATLNPIVIAYIPLTMSGSCARPAPTTDEIAAEFSGNYFNGSFGVVSNTLTLSWAYRIKGATEWATGGTFAAGTAYAITDNMFDSAGAVSLGTIFDYTQNYEIALYFADALTSGNSGPILVTKGIPVFDWGEDDFAFHVPVSMAEPLGVPYGGIGRASVTAGRYLVGAGTDAMTEQTPAQVLGAIGAMSRAKLLWSGSFSAGSLVVPGLSDYLLIAVEISGFSLIMFGTPLWGGTVYGTYGSYAASYACYRFAFTEAENKLTINSADLGVATNNTSYPATKIWGLIKKTEVAA